MDHTLVDVSVPFLIEFVMGRRRNAEGKIFWEDGTVAIQTVTAQQAPAVCRVHPAETSRMLEFSIRSFDSRLWWPLIEGQRHMPATDYAVSATKSEGPFLSMMNLSPATVCSHPREDAKRFFDQIFARRVDAPSSEERWRSPQRIAHRTLFCDDLVYIEGGPPVYFGVRGGTPDNPTVSLEIGSAAAEDLPGVSRYLPGPRPKERREAACQLLVFGMECIEDHVDFLWRRGFSVTFGSRAEADAELRSHRDACEICADALVRKAAATIGPRSFQGPENMVQKKLQTAARLPRQIPSQLCRDIIDAMTAECPEDEFFARFGVEFEYAADALARLNAIHRPLSELDDQALVDLPN
jgi:hypothetical protein